MTANTLTINELKQKLIQRNRMLYLGYGSNMLEQRVLINNPSMELVGVARLEGFRFAFQGYAKLWNSAVANIVADEKSHVYGVVYTMDLSQLDNLNKQERGFDLVNVTINILHVGQIECGVYVQNLAKQPDHPNTSELPSALYKKCCIVGAIQHNLPEEYINVLRSFKDNGKMNEGPQQVIDLIGEPEVKKCN